jgi:hypothetical protein
MISPALWLPFLLPVALAMGSAHPHNPKALTLHGAAGKTTLTYFTVPFNAEHLADLGEGFEWHLGYAALDTEVPLEVGGQKVPPGRYKLGVVRGKDEASWSVLLQPFDLWRAEGQARRGRDPDAAARAREQVAALREALAEKGVPERIEASTQGVEAGAAEHLEMTVHFAGYDATERFGTEPASGMRMRLRIDFGSLHREVAIHELWSKSE